MNSDALKIGDKVCLVGKPGTAIVRYIGRTQFQSGIWVGIELDHAGYNETPILQNRRKKRSFCPRYSIFLMRTQSWTFFEGKSISCCKGDYYLILVSPEKDKKGALLLI
jgi:dynactin complex subunit